MSMTTDTPEIREKLWSMIKSVQIAMLTTVDNGHLRARPMAASQKEFDGTLWFFTRGDSHKVEEGAGNQVGVTYADAGQQNYVSLSGKAELVRDKDVVQAHWAEYVRVWFPKGVDDPNIALLKVSIEAAEYWDAPNSKMIHAYGYVKAIVTGAPPQAGENKKVSFA